MPASIKAMPGAALLAKGADTGEKDCIRRLAHALQAARDQELHDLVRAGVNAHYARIPVHARDREFLHVAVAAKELQTAVDNLSLHIGDPVFRHRGGHGIERAVEITLDTVVVKN